MLRVVLDTNLFVSSLLVKAGLPAKAMEAWRQRRFLLVTSPAIMAEVQATLSYPRIRRKYHVTDQDVTDLIDLLRRDALVVPGISDVVSSLPTDPNDEMVLACALDAGADVIVSGDRHLLELGSFRSIPILTVRQFVEQL
ncbi:MAG: putative toxin-antitoxin system toxin component, PIN family [Chloroflexota bacterium]